MKQYIALILILVIVAIISSCSSEESKQKAKYEAKLKESVKEYEADKIKWHKESIQQSLAIISNNAVRFIERLKSEGGGEGSLINYKISEKLFSEESIRYSEGTYKLISVTEKSCQIQGTSRRNTSWIIILTLEIGAQGTAPISTTNPLGFNNNFSFTFSGW